MRLEGSGQRACAALALFNRAAKKATVCVEDVIIHSTSGVRARSGRRQLKRGKRIALDTLAKDSRLSRFPWCVPAHKTLRDIVD